MEASDPARDLPASHTLDVYDRSKEPQLVMIMRLVGGMLEVDPSEGARAQLEQDLREGREEASHLPIIGWLVEKAVEFAEHRMADYFGRHDLRKVQMRFDGTRMHLHVGRASMDLGPGEIDPGQAAAFVAEFERRKAR